MGIKRNMAYYAVKYGWPYARGIGGAYVGYAGGKKLLSSFRSWRNRAAQRKAMPPRKKLRRGKYVYKPKKVNMVIKPDDGHTRSSSILKRKGRQMNKQKFSEAAKETTFTDATATLYAIMGKQTVSTVAYTHFPTQLKSLWDNYITHVNNGAANETPLYQSSRMYLGKAYQEIELKNNSNNGCKVFIYDVVCRDEDATSPGGDWDYDDQNPNVVNLMANDFPGCHPNTCQKFKDNWKIYRRIEIEIPAGGTHIHRKSVSWNKIIDKYEFASDGVNADGSCLPNLTTATMICHYGDLVDDDGAATNKVTTGPCKLICRVATTMKARFFPFSGNLINGYTNNLLSLGEEPVFVAEDIDAKVTYEDA